MEFRTITTMEEFEETLNDNLGVLFYFSTISCNVGEALEPKVLDRSVDFKYPYRSFGYYLYGKWWYKSG